MLGRFRCFGSDFLLETNSTIDDAFIFFYSINTSSAWRSAMVSIFLREKMSIPDKDLYLLGALLSAGH